MTVEKEVQWKEIVLELEFLHNFCIKPLVHHYYYYYHLDECQRYKLYSRIIDLHNSTTTLQ